MEHLVDLAKVSDGKQYSLTDSVPLSCDGCRNLSEHAKCCHFAEDTITLDPFDVALLHRAGYPFVTLFQQGIVALSPVSSVLLPHLNFTREGCCPFLDKKSKCTIHDFRPGLCRLFPLARGFQDQKLFYIKQIHECPCSAGQTVSVREWIGISDAAAYEQFCLSWHLLLSELQKKLASASGQEALTALSTRFLTLFFFTPYRQELSFFDQFAERKKEFEEK